MNEPKLQKWIKGVENKLRNEPGFTDDFTGEIRVNTTQGGANAVVVKKHLTIVNTEKQK